MFTFLEVPCRAQQPFAPWLWKSGHNRFRLDSTGITLGDEPPGSCYAVSLMISPQSIETEKSFLTSGLWILVRLIGERVLEKVEVSVNNVPRTMPTFLVSESHSSCTLQRFLFFPSEVSRLCCRQMRLFFTEQGPWRIQDRLLSSVACALGSTIPISQVQTNHNLLSHKLRKETTKGWENQPEDDVQNKAVADDSNGNQGAPQTRHDPIQVLVGIPCVVSIRHVRVGSCPRHLHI